MFKMWLCCAGAGLMGLLVASCAATPQTLAAAAASAAATQVASAATQAAANNANTPAPAAANQHPKLIYFGPNYVLVRRQDGSTIVVMHPPANP